VRPLRSLAGRVTLAAVAATALAIVAGGVAVVVAAERSDRGALDNELSRLADRLSRPAGGLLQPDQPAGPGSLGPGPPGESPQRSRPGTSATTELDPSGDRFARVLNSAQGTISAGVAVPKGFPLTPPNRITTVHAGGNTWRALTVQLPRGGAKLQAAIELGPLEARSSRLRTIVVIVALAALALTGLVAYLLARLALRPLEELRASSARIAGSGDPSERMATTSGPDEVKELAADLDTMLERLERSAAARDSALQAARRFAADAGHELRTPLTSLRANLAAALRGIDGDEAAGARAALAACEDDAERLAGLVAQLQALARGDAGPPPSPEPVELAELADAALASVRVRHRGVQAELNVDGAGVTVRGDATGLRMLLDNLFENAALHGRSQGHVAVTIDRVAGAARITVDDDGPGIPAAERSVVLGRFVRGSDVRKPGSGLGLAIVAAEARRHGGTLELGDSPLGGLRARVDLRDAA
jgi:two-component system, OmpR family, sensor histidine kinase PrrB